MKKILVQFIIGAIVGFFGAYGILKFSDFNFAADVFVIFLLGLALILSLLSLVFYQHIKKLSKTEFTGDREDEVGELKYKKFTDYSICTNSGLIISILALSLSIIATSQSFFIISSIILLIVHYLMNHYMIRLTQYVYPERNIPNISDPDFPKSVLDLADDGEKFVILNGLYKSYNLLNITLIIAILLATVYSISSDNSSQLFSIITMSIVLLLVNGKYLLAVRNK